MKHCNFCGTNNPDTSKFCSNCGRNLEYRISNVSPKQDRRERVVSETIPYGEKNMSTIFKVVLTVLLFGVVFVFILFFFETNNSVSKLIPLWFVVIFPLLKKIWN